MNVTITSKEIADAIATQVEDATGKDCGVYTNETAALVAHHNSVIARITPLFDVVAVAPIGGEYSGIITEVPMAAKTLDNIRDMALAIDEATAHVLSAAMAL